MYWLIDTNKTPAQWYFFLYPPFPHWPPLPIVQPCCLGKGTGRSGCDCVASKYGCRIQGTTDVAFTVLDVLGYLDEIPVCVGYNIDGEVTTDFPTTSKLKKAKPVYETLPGWKTDIRGIKKYEDLPENCRKYIEFVEEHIGFPITMISNGPGRNDIIYRNAK